MASTPDRIVTSDDLLRRSHEHSEIVADLVDTGHRLGMRAWIASREQVRRVRGRHLTDWLDESERRQGPPRVGRARPETTSTRSTSCGRSAVEPASCSRSSGRRCSASRSCGAARSSRRPTTPSGSSWSSPSERSSSATSSSDRRSCGQRWRTGNWHILKANHLRAFAAHEAITLVDLEPYIGLDPAIEHRGGEQMPLFAG